MKRDKIGDVVVLAGNNKKKTDYIYQSIDASLHVLSDKPMAINKEGFEELRRAFELAEDKGVLLYDIMTERYNIFFRFSKRSWFRAQWYLEHCKREAWKSLQF